MYDNTQYIPRLSGEREDIGWNRGGFNLNQMRRPGYSQKEMTTRDKGYIHT